MSNYQTMEATLAEASMLLNEEEVKSLVDALHKRHGIDFRCYDHKTLNQRIARAISLFGFKSTVELWIEILVDRGFLYPFMDEISVCLPAMFRDAVLWKRIQQILKEVDHGKEPLRIWHAGCSTGEEVYTMGIVLKESGMKRPYTVWATDINKRSIGQARLGEYHKSNVAGFTANYKKYNSIGELSNYYKTKHNTIQFDPQLITNVSFGSHHLFTDSFEKKFDIIFCRSVMIYFDNKAKEMLFKKFHESLNQGGCLVIGSYDAKLEILDKDRFEIYDLEARIFSRRSN